MEIVKSRYGVERSIERVNLNKVRVMGESQFIRKSTNKYDEISMFDFRVVLVIRWEQSYSSKK